MDPSPYVLDENLPILQVPGGTRAFLNVLVLTKTLVVQVSRDDPNAATFAPVICPLISEKKKLRLAECVESDAKRVLKEIFGKDGGRFFQVFIGKRGRRDQDFLDYHWEGIKGSSCKYCMDPTRVNTLQAFARIRSNCKVVYQPLKATMVKNLQFVRYVPQTQYCRLNKSEDPYEGLVAGITEDGVLCGVYLVKGLQTV